MPPIHSATCHKLLWLSWQSKKNSKFKGRFLLQNQSHKDYFLSFFPLFPSLRICIFMTFSQNQLSGFPGFHSLFWWSEFIFIWSLFALKIVLVNHLLRHFQLYSNLKWTVSVDRHCEWRATCKVVRYLNITVSDYGATQVFLGCLISFYLSTVTMKKKNTQTRYIK